MKFNAPAATTGAIIPAAGVSSSVKKVCLAVISAAFLAFMGFAASDDTG